MKRIALALLLCTSAFAQSPVATFRLHPDNPHYFMYQNRPTVLVGSGEHYGAVINLDFDYKTYLRTLAADGLNNTRLFTGAYIEKLGDFGIQKNTLAPEAGRLILPWARSNEPGYALGGNKFDLAKWDEAYFARLRDFMTEAQRQGVIVEVNLFSSYYGTGWPYSALNRANNINNTSDVLPNHINTPVNENLLEYQERYVRKIVRELNGFDNLYFEIQNEPWADLKDTVMTRNEYHTTEKGKTDWRATLEVVSEPALDWQRRVAGWIVAEEKQLPKKHLISQNISNFRYPIVSPNPNVSIFTFHYALPEAVTDNYALNKPIGFNETGFAGRSDITYRRQAWRFLMAGGALFNHLDYSFSVGSENGQDTTYQAPGGGSPALRKQLGGLKHYFDGLPISSLKPTALVASPGALAWALTNNTTHWIVYAEPVTRGTYVLTINLPQGKYRAEWTNVATGQPIHTENIIHTGASRQLTSPVRQADVVVKLIKQ
ncbi:hypothetical protein BN8_03888 [Fibrisoma limi BUZ 3]|uniref:Glycoside hydrolase family 5 domain-containing protein n=1 Tax=Fibrisoma limi BUZ 3 TaxID=1185876 RepID=I2GLB6_9BACT|nr:hypothetical protein [Fibrisoma limi]CCH54692.1 hypothetical protein BN8_03888 [Fibrisoma limi BUZ 3]